MALQPVEDVIKQLAYALRQEQENRKALEQQFAQQVAHMKGLIESMTQGRAQLKTIEDLPGKRVQYWLSLDLTITASTATVTKSVEVGRDGPLVVTAIMAAWKPDSGATGLWRPVASTSIQSITDMAVAETHILDFTFEITDRGSDRKWQNNPIPSAYLYGIADRPAYLSVSCVFEPTSTIEVAITPTVAPSEAGKLNFCFQGYKIITIEQLEVG